MSEKYLGQEGLSKLIELTKSEIAAKQDTLVSGTNIKTINNESLLGAGNIDINATPMVETTWAALKALRDGAQLIPGMQYRITDYVTTVRQDGDYTSSWYHYKNTAGHPFDIIVKALSSSILSAEANAIQHAGDTYFRYCRLDRWKLLYSLDNDVNLASWIDQENGKGVIYKMVDEFNNEAYYDFKNIRFYGYPYYYFLFNSTRKGRQGEDRTVPVNESMIEVSSTVHDNKIEYQVYRGYPMFPLKLPKWIVFVNSSTNNGCHDCHIKTRGYEYSSGGSGFWIATSHHIFMDDPSRDITIEEDCSFIRFEDGCSDITVRSNSSHLIFGPGCSISLPCSAYNCKFGGGIWGISFSGFDSSYSFQHCNFGENVNNITLSPSGEYKKIPFVTIGANVNGNGRAERPVLYLPTRQSVDSYQNPEVVFRASGYEEILI